MEEVGVAQAAVVGVMTVEEVLGMHPRLEFYLLLAVVAVAADTIIIW